MDPQERAELDRLAEALFEPAVADSVKTTLDRGAQALTARSSTKEAIDLGSLWRGIGAINPARWYGELKAGALAGTLSLRWNGADDNTVPSFVFVPEPGTELTFTRADGTVVRPGAMLTDGGTIPRFLHVKGEFSPWLYGPAYIVHDWLFTAKKCGFGIDDHYRFEETAVVMSEVIKTIMTVGAADIRGTVRTVPEAPRIAYLMEVAVLSDIARDKWNTPFTDAMKDATKALQDRFGPGGLPA